MESEKTVRISFQGTEEDQYIIKLLAAKRRMKLRELVMSLVKEAAKKEGIES
jgi:hypothetical protein